MESAAERIKKARLEAKLSLDGLALLAGTSRRHLIRLEAGKHEPTHSMLSRIAAATGKPLTYFREAPR